MNLKTESWKSTPYGWISGTCDKNFTAIAINIWLWPQLDWPQIMAGHLFPKLYFCCMQVNCPYSGCISGNLRPTPKKNIQNMSNSSFQSAKPSRVFWAPRFFFFGTTTIYTTKWSPKLPWTSSPSEFSTKEGEACQRWMSWGGKCCAGSMCLSDQFFSGSTSLNSLIFAHESQPAAFWITFFEAESLVFCN